MKKTLLLFAMIAFGLSVIAQNSAPQTATATATAGTLSVTTTTSSTGGSYAPKNIMAVWIVNNSGVFVKSLLVYAATRQQHLYTWIASTSTKNKVDAITGSTQTSHGTRTCSWNGKDVNGVDAPDGTYTLKMELTDKNSQGNVGSFDFVKGSSYQTLTPANVASFSNNTITWTPVNSAINDVEIEKLYSVYPNPAISSIYVTGSDVEEVQICSLSGRSLLTSNIQKINISKLPKGSYLAVVRAKAGTVVKKIVKL